MGSVRNTSCGATETTCEACDVLKQSAGKEGPGPETKTGRGSCAAQSTGPRAGGAVGVSGGEGAFS